MLAFFLLLVIVAIVLGIVAVVARGLLYLLIIGIAVFLGAPSRRRPENAAPPWPALSTLIPSGHL
jgi:hypothetical protein